MIRQFIFTRLTTRSTWQVLLRKHCKEGAAVVTHFWTSRDGEVVYLFWTECRSLTHVCLKIDKSRKRNIFFPKPCLSCFFALFILPLFHLGRSPITMRPFFLGRSPIRMRPFSIFFYLGRSPIIMRPFFPLGRSPIRMRPLFPLFHLGRSPITMRPFFG